MTKEDVTWYHLQHLFLFSFLFINHHLRCWLLFFSPNLWPHHKCFETLEKGMNRLVSKRTSWSVVGFCLFGLFFSLLHYGKPQYCIHVSAVCFSNVCSNRRSTSLLAFVALTAFKNKCPVTVRRGRRTSNLFLLLTDERARPNGRAQILRKGRRNGKAPVQSACL